MIQFGMLGCARIGRRGMINALQNSGVSQLAGIASRQLETAREWAAEFGIPKSFGAYEELIADPGIDAVYIPLPNELHLEWTLKAAAAGKHVLCEKPLARTVAEAQEMVSGCRRYRVLLMEAFMWRHHPRTASLRQMVADGQLGELRFVKMDFSFCIDPADWRLDPNRGGGALFDLGCYGINAARLFTGQEPVEILARSRRHASGVDLTTGIQLSFENGAMALLDASFECPNRNRLEIVGTKGAVELTDGVLPAAKAELRLRTDEGVTTQAFAEACQYTEQVRVFCAGIAAGKLPDPAEDGLANMRVVENVLAQLKGN